MTRYLMANWKMYSPALPAWLQAVSMVHLDESINVVLFPPFVRLGAAQMAVSGTHIDLGGQDCHHEKEGAYTGDVSADMLKRTGCSYVLCGHSERRTYHGETDDMVCAKAQAALEEGLIPVICVGETREAYEAGQTEQVLKKQLAASLPHAVLYNKAELPCVIAYEPVWAIGTGLTPTLDEIASTHAFISNQVPEGAGVLYGGSVKESNISDICDISGVDGALVGSASLDGESFAAMLRAYQTL